MRLYHFTKTANLLPIKERGLLPSVDEGMSHHPVVWLTTEPYPNMRVTIDANRISVEPPENNLVRLTVEVPNDGRLFRYVTWPDRTGRNHGNGLGPPTRRWRLRFSSTGTSISAASPRSWSPRLCRWCQITAPRQPIDAPEFCGRRGCGRRHTRPRTVRGPMPAPFALPYRVASCFPCTSSRTREVRP